MSYKALLFCPDEKTARAVTQVLSELEFTVERSGEPFATVKKLTDEHFDALVVDCQNEQDASLLFKGARNSTFNHSSLSVAVVEGQAGVAKAFRIGANLVLTKPINTEQSKSTLRVARGLLRKTEAKQAAVASSQPAKTFTDSPIFSSKPAPGMPVAPTATSAAKPFSALELEKEPTPAPEPAEVAVLGSLRDPVKPLASHEQPWPDALKRSAQPVAAGMAGQATAAAPALAKPTIEIKTAPPLATQEAIVADHRSSEPFQASAAHAPTFSSYAQASEESGGGKKILAIAAILLIVGAIGYVGVKKLKPSHNSNQAGPAQVAAPASDTVEIAKPSPAVQETYSPAKESNSFTSTSSSSGSETPERYTPETIQVDDDMAAAEPKITVTPKPLVVKTKGKTSNQPGQAATQPDPPPLELSAANNSDTTMASLVSTNAAVPKAAPTSTRVSQGVAQGLIVKRVSPTYPPVALQQRKQGAVELLATVSKDGAITGVKVLSGESILAKSAVDAVRQWKYRPYLLNGEPVEIETQITVKFTLPR
jgi:TonB family protein